MFSFLLLLIHSVQATPQTLAPITIIAKRPTFNVGSSTTVPTKITAITLNERQYRQLNEALAAIPSLMVVTAGGIGQQTAVFSRGLSANQLQVRVDGMRMNSPSEPTGTFDFANFNNAAVKQICLTRGVLSSFYGTGSLGGVVDMRTTTSEEATKGSAFFEAGSHNTVRGQVGFQGNSNKLYFNVYGGSTKTDGYQQTLPKYRLPTGEYKKLAYNLNQGAATMGGHNDKIALTFYNRFYTAHGHFHNYQGMMRPHHQRQSLHRVELLAKGDWQHCLGLGALLAHQVSEPGQSNYSQNDGKRFQFDWHQQMSFNESHKIAFLIEAVRDQITVKTPAHVIQKSQQQLGGALYYTALIDKFTFESALRAEHSNHFHIPITGGVGLAYQLLPATKIFTNLSTTYREPTLYQLFGKNLYFEGNPQLKPEKGRGAEFGLKQQIIPTLSLHSSYFRYDMKQLIESVANQYINMNFAKSQGLDTILNWYITSDFSLELGYCYTQTQDYLRRSLLRRPKHKFVAKMTLKKEKWLLAADIVSVSKRVDVSLLGGARGTAKAYTTVHLKGDYTLNESWQLFSRIDNLFNRKIEEPLGYRKAGISLYAGLKSQF